MIEDYKNKVKFAEDGLEKAIDRRDYLLKIASHKETIEDIDDLFRQRDVSYADMRDLEGRIKTIHEIQVSVLKCKKTLEAGEAIKEISIYLDRRLKVSAKSTKLRLTLENLNLITESIYDLEEYLKAVPLTHSLQLLILERTETIETWNKITGTIVRIQRIEHEIKTQSGLIESYQSHINELSEALDGIESCEVCGSLKEHWRL
jgi:prefoldin subunit 5